MKLFTCFDDAIEDGVPLGWALRWRAREVAASVTELVRPAVGSPDPPVKRRVLRHYSADATAVPSAISWDTAGSLADFEALMAFKTSLAFVFRFRCSGVASTEAEGYRLWVVSSGHPGPSQNSIQLNRTAAGVEGAALANVPKTITVSKWHYVRVLVSGTSLKAKTWASDVTEPAAYDIDITDAGISAAGWMGWQNWSNGNADNTSLNFLSLATGSDTPQVPLTNAEFSTWLAASGKVRRELVEMSALGYADNGGGDGTYTKETKVFVANGGFVSKAWDTPPSQLYSPWVTKSGKFTREMGIALSGEATIGFGSVSISNPAGATGVGVRDDWLRMKWKRNYVKSYVGDPSWPKHDFRCFLLGRLQRPKANGGEIDFPVNDLSDIFENDVNAEQFMTGDYIGQRKPRLYGSAGRAARPSYDSQIEPPRTDSSTNTYTLVGLATPRWHGGGAINGWHGGSAVVTDHMTVYDDQVALDTGDLTITSVSGNAITSAGHGMLDGWPVYFGTGTLPTPLIAGFRYYAKATTANTLEVSLTLGGASVVLTSSTAGAHFIGFGWDTNASAIGAFSATLDANIILHTEAVGRVTVGGFAQTSDDARLYRVYAQVFSDIEGLPEGWLDPQSFPVGGDTFFWVGTEKTAGKEVLERLSKGTFSWYGFSQDGFLQYGELRLPEATAVMEFIESEVKDESLRPVSQRLPVNFATAELKRPYFFTGPPFPTGSQAAVQGFVIVPPYTYPATGVPLDDHPTLGEMDETFKGELLYTTEFTYHRTLLGKIIGAFEFDTTLKAAELRFGQTISLSHSRYGWKNYTTESVSPDNAVDFDARLAVVIGISVDPDSEFPVKLTVFRQVPGYHPQDSVLGDYLVNAHLLEDGTEHLLEDGTIHEMEGS